MSSLTVEIYSETAVAEPLDVTALTAEVFAPAEVLSITEPGASEVVEIYGSGELVEIFAPVNTITEVYVPTPDSGTVSESVTLVELVTEVPPEVIEVVVSGEQGPPGLSGSSSTSSTKNFSIASDTWEFTHNLGFIPNVSCQTLDGKGFRGRVEFNDEVQTVVSFYNPVAGRLILS